MANLDFAVTNTIGGIVHGGNRKNSKDMNVLGQL
jgi:hypothetical protein